MVDKREEGGYTTPIECAGDYATFISRIRQDSTTENGLNLWCVSDNLRKGAALNAVQIAELLGNKVLKKEQWGLRSFAYKINKNKKGHYFMLNLDSAPTTIFEYERQMRINEDIIRFLTIKIDQIDEKLTPTKPFSQGIHGPSGKQVHKIMHLIKFVKI